MSEEEEVEKPARKKQKKMADEQPYVMEEPRTKRGISDNENYILLIEDAIRGIGGRATGNEITEWIAKRHVELSTDKKKLGYRYPSVCCR